MKKGWYIGIVSEEYQVSDLERIEWGWDIQQVANEIESVGMLHNTYLLCLLFLKKRSERGKWIETCNHQHTRMEQIPYLHHANAAPWWWGKIGCIWSWWGRGRDPRTSKCSSSGRDALHCPWTARASLWKGVGYEIDGVIKQKHRHTSSQTYKQTQSSEEEV